MLPRLDAFVRIRFFGILEPGANAGYARRLMNLPVSSQPPSY